MIKDKIKNGFTKALKGKKEVELSVLRILKAEILNREKEKRYKLIKGKLDIKAEDLEKESCLTDDEILAAILSQIKKSREAIVDFEKGKRKDLVEREEREIEILKEYLPEQISKEEVVRIAREVIEETGAKGVREMGKVMSGLMAKMKGRAEGSLVSKVVKELLAKDDRNQ